MVNPIFLYHVVKAAIRHHCPRCGQKLVVRDRKKHEVTCKNCGRKIRLKH